MSSKKQTDTDRFVTFAMVVTEDTLSTVIESMTAIRNHRFPRTPVKPKASRKPRADKGTTRRGLPPSASNGGDTNAISTE